MAYIQFSLPHRLCHSALHLPNRPGQLENICIRRSALQLLYARRLNKYGLPRMSYQVFDTFFFSAKRKYCKEKPLGISPVPLNSSSLIHINSKCLAHFRNL